MPYKATVFKVVISSPSDVGLERQIARDEIILWNAANAETKGFLLQPIMWETDTTPESGDRAQAIINRQLKLDEGDADLLVAIFWSRLGSPTGKDPSGTAEEIRLHTEAGKPAMIYFIDKDLPRDVDTEQLQRLNTFKEQIIKEDKDYVWKCKTTEIFQDNFRHHLQLKINKEPYFEDEAKKQYYPTNNIKIDTSIPDPSSHSSILEIIKEGQENLLEAVRRENERNREAVEERNRIEAENEVLNNLGVLADNLEESVAIIDNKKSVRWKNPSRNLIVGFNLSRLVEHSIEILVKITREEKENNPLLAQFAQEVIDKGKKDLKGKIFSKQDLNRAQLSEAQLGWANLIGADLTAADLTMANLIGADLTAADLTRADLMMADLSKARLSGVDLSEANLNAANLREAFLSGSIMKKVNLRDSNLVRAMLEDCDLSDADLTGADLNEALLLNAEGISTKQIKKASNWEKAHYDAEFRKKLGLSSEE